MSNEFDLPWVANKWYVFLIFSVALLVFHWALVFRWPLGKTAWKKVDYVWLSLALLGIFGLASETRQIFARSMKAWADTRLEASIARLQMRLDNYTEGSALCRKFNRTELSPPPGELEKIQNEYDAMCEWHRTIKPIFPKSTTEIRDEINPKRLQPIPEVTDPILSVAQTALTSAVENFNSALRAQRYLQKKSQRDEIEFLIFILSPILLAIALALRLTKVTGEIRLDARQVGRAHDERQIRDIEFDTNTANANSHQQSTQ